MPRYNLNHQDINTIINGLDYMSLNAPSAKEHSRIINLKNRLIAKLSSNPDEEEDDIWSTFNGED